MPEPMKPTRASIQGFADARPDSSGNHNAGDVSLPRSVEYTGDARPTASTKGSPSGRSGWKDADGSYVNYDH